MLSKLLKYEIKATGRIFIPLFLSLVAFAVINKFISAFNPQNWHAPATITMVLYIIIMAGMFVMTFTVMIQRFYKNLLSDEGYLMHTLPVRPWKHIVSKLLVSMLWMIASVLVAMLSIFIISYQKGAIGEIFRGLVTFHHQMIGHWGGLSYLLTFEIILVVLVSLASGILLVYTSIAIGHRFSRHKMLASFCAFIVLNTLSQIYFKLPRMLPGMAHFSIHSANEFVTYQSLFGYVFIFIAIHCAAYFAATNYILSKRLNLE